MIVSAILALKGRDVVTIAGDKSILDAVATLGARRIGALVVTEGRDRIVGVISERDIVKAIAHSGPGILSEVVASIMTRDVVTCAEGETIDQVMGRMTRGRFRHLPVAKAGRLAGVISIGDVVKARIEEVEREAEEMRSYIATA
ncbi:MAG: CBS domain-containing protein [Bauldia sp.]|nr:CBS domain-containing protein [Bauldia sp.]